LLEHDIKNVEIKYILKKALEKIVPKENLYRPKMGFTIPLDKWFKGNLNKYYKEKLFLKLTKFYGAAASRRRRTPREPQAKSRSQ